MQFWFIFSLLFAIFVAIFAVMNSDVVTIQFLGWEHQLSQSVVILVSATLGALLTFFMSLFGKVKSGMKSRDNKHQIATLEKAKKDLEESNKNYQIEVERLKAKLEHEKSSKSSSEGISKTTESTKGENL